MPLIRAALLLLLLIPSAAAAQMPARVQSDAVVPGSPVLRPAEVREGVDTVGMVMTVNGRSLPIGMLVVETRRVTAPGGAPAVWRVETTTSRLVASTVDTFVVQMATLAAVSNRTHEDRVAALDYAGGMVRGTIAEGGAVGRVEVPLPAPVFYDGAMDIVLGALPLADGYEAHLPVYDDEAGAVAWRLVRVAGSDSLPGEGGMADAWRVETSRGTTRSTYWMDKRTRRMLRWALPVAGGGEIRIVR
ncbi:MAG TPA: hypothetical protein VFH27_13070 [Longimicrobiaceae bacterium]|nr:hypothetical protein [Longimicrobiaceae bacterium]